MPAAALRLGARLRRVRRRVARENAVHRAPRVLQDGERLRGLLVVGEPGDLVDGRAEGRGRLHERLDPGPRPLVRDLPRLGQLGGVLRDVPAPGVGEVEDLAAVGVPGLHETLVLQLLQDRVHGAGARPPQTATASGQLGHDRVAVPRLLGQQCQDRRPHVAAPTPPAPAGTVGAVPATGTETGAAGPGTGTEPGTEPRTEAGSEPGTTRTEARSLGTLPEAGTLQAPGAEAAGPEAGAEAAPTVPLHLVEHRVPHL